MRKGLVGALIIVGILAAAYALFLNRKRVGQEEVVQIVLSVDSGDCVQKVGGRATDKVSIQEGQTVEYSAENNVPFNVNFGAAGIISTGSPFPDANGKWQLNFNSPNGAPVSSMSSRLTFPEWLLGVTDFPYRSVSIDGKACTVRTGGGVYIER